MHSRGDADLRRGLRAHDRRSDKQRRETINTAMLAH
jgi:hypothetical protein